MDNNFQIAFAAAAKVSGVSVADMLTMTRTRELTVARQVAILLLRGESYTDEQIGWMLGRRRAAITKSRHAAYSMLEISHSFNRKLERAREIYEQKKKARAWAMEHAQ